MNPSRWMRLPLAVLMLALPTLASAQECGIIYVTPNGASSGQAGTKANPASLAHAFTLFGPQARHLRIAHGVYPLSEHLDIPSNIILEGGYRASDWKKTNADTTIFQRSAANHDVTNRALIAFKGVGSSNFRIQDLCIKVADAPGSGVSVYGIYLSQCADYYVSRCIIRTGRGSDGENGAPGAPGMPGAQGQVGQPGIDEGNCCRAGGQGGQGSFPGSHAGGRGGDGGEWGGFEVQQVCAPIINLCQWIVTPGSEFTNPGQSGLPGQGPGAGVGGQRGIGLCEITYAVETCPSQPINWGKPGTQGLEGIDGNPGLQGYATVANGFYAPATGSTGNPGQTHGAGGGGGGGGGGKGCEPAALQPYSPTNGPIPYNSDTVYNTAGSGAGGGGGGEGGQLGQGGLGGLGGGGSFCVFVNENGQNGVVQDCRFLPSAGGVGGQGGPGGPGGAGGLGGAGGSLNDNQAGTASCNTGVGGNGGRGGDGGTGGPGGRGSDGISRGLHQVGSGAPVLDPNIYNPWEPTITVEHFGCTNSDVHVSTTATGTLNWIFGFGAQPPSSPSQSQTAQYGSPTGSRNLTLIVDGVPYFYANYILVQNDFTPPAITASRNTICAGQSTDLSTSSDAITYQWTIPGGSITSSASQNPGTVTFSAPGDYVVELVTTSCCGTSRTTDTIHVLEQVNVDLGPDLRACFLGGTPVLDANGNPGASYSWTRNGQPVGTNSRFLTTTFTATYGVTIDYGGGCSGSDQVFVEIYTVTPVNLGPDLAICPNSPLPILNAGIGSANYAWTLNGNPIGANSIMLEGSQPGTYGVTVTEFSGCSGTDQLNVLVSQPIVQLGNDINVCANAAFPVLDAQNPGATYQWLLGGQPISGATQQTYQPGSGGNFSVLMTNIYGCTATDDITINTFPTLNAAFNAPLNAELGSPVQFVDATTPAANQWTWNFGDGSALVTVQNPQHNFLQVGERPVFMIASNGICSDTAFAIVDVLYNCAQLGVSAAFSVSPDPVILSGFGMAHTVNQSQNATHFVWDFGDGSGPRYDVSPIHAYTQPGTYTITLTATNYNCTSSTTQTVTVESTGVSVEEVLADGALQVYPNPNDGRFVVQLDLGSPTDIRIALNNALGQRVYREEITNRRHWRKEFDLSNFVKGVYVLEAATPDGILHRRIVIQ